jgi:hypothetical protein
MPNNWTEMNELVAIEKIAQGERLKKLVLDSVSSPITKRVYNMALNEFMEWFQQAPRPGFTKATVSAWRVSRRGAPSHYYQDVGDSQVGGRSHDNGLLAPELARGISHAEGVKVAQPWRTAFGAFFWSSAHGLRWSPEARKSIRNW